MRNACFLIIFCLSNFIVAAQRQFINGLLKDSVTGAPISGARISNTTINDIVFTNQKGFFRIQVADGDRLILGFTGYNPHFLSYSSSPNKDTLIIYLLPLGKTLPTVTISTGYNQYKLDSINRRKDFEQFRGSRLNNVSQSGGFGIAINLDRLFKQRYKHQRKNEKRFKEREKQAYMAYRYSPALVTYFTGLEGDSLKNFMNQHTPSYEWLRKHLSDEDIVFYISEHLKIYRKNSQ
jgi:hypothetical protein